MIQKKDADEEAFRRKRKQGCEYLGNIGQDVQAKTGASTANEKDKENSGRKEEINWKLKRFK